jgi:alpha-tubulin suppressor-like RCC1 family protein
VGTRANIFSEDELYSFGNNSFGQLGFGDPTQNDVIPIPTLVNMLSDKKVASLVAGACFSLVLSGTRF